MSVFSRSVVLVNATIEFIENILFSVVNSFEFHFCQNNSYFHLREVFRAPMIKYWKYFVHDWNGWWFSKRGCCVVSTLLPAKWNKQFKLRFPNSNATNWIRCFDSTSLLSAATVVAATAVLMLIMEPCRILFDGVFRNLNIYIRMMCTHMHAACSAKCNSIPIIFTDAKMKILLSIIIIS